MPLSTPDAREPTDATTTIATVDHRDAGRAIGRIAFPTGLAILGDQLLGIVDTIAIGTLGTHALAGITAATSVFLIFAIGTYGFSSGLRILGAQAIGAGRSDRFGTIVRSATIVPLGVAIVVALAFAFASRPLMAFMLPPAVSAEPAAAYLALRMASLVPIAVTSQLIAAFATAGDTRMSLRVLVAINLVHIPLLAFLALGFGTHHPLGLAGAALSSLLAECVGLGYAIVLAARRPDLGILRSHRIEARDVRLATSLSWPDFVFLTLQIVPDPITVALFAPQGAQGVAALRALIIVNDATWAIPGSFSGACETILGQRIGAGDYAGARRFLRAARRIALRISSIVAAVVAVFAWPLAALVTLSPTLATLAFAPLAALVALTLPLKGLAMVNNAPIRAAGDTRWIMLMGIVTTMFSTALIVIGIEFAHIGLWSLPFGFATAWVLRNVVTYARLRGGDWERRRLG